MKEFFQKYWKVIVIVLLLVILFPKEIGYGYGGEIIAQQTTLYREEKVCFGIKYSKYGGPFLKGSCNDCSKTIYCVGIPLQNKCYEADFDMSLGEERETECFKRP